MNIFAIEGSTETQEVDWIKSAQSLDNYRVVKMPTETCQICLPEKFNDGNLITSYRKFYASKPNLRYPVSKIPEWLSEYRDLKTIEII